MANPMTDEICTENDLFCRPPGHSTRVVKDSDVILFGPQREHTPIMGPTLSRMKG